MSMEELKKEAHFIKIHGASDRPKKNNRFYEFKVYDKKQQEYNERHKDLPKAIRYYTDSASKSVLKDNWCEIKRSMRNVETAVKKGEDPEDLIK